MTSARLSLIWIGSELNSLCFSLIRVTKLWYHYQNVLIFLKSLLDYSWNQEGIRTLRNWGKATRILQWLMCPYTWLMVSMVLADPWVPLIFTTLKPLWRMDLAWNIYTDFSTSLSCNCRLVLVLTTLYCEIYTYGHNHFVNFMEVMKSDQKCSRHRLSTTHSLWKGFWECLWKEY